MLILDDYHSIHDLVIHKAMGFLLEALPHSVYLVLATRHDPPIALSRLRGRGQMTEIRQADLRFSQEEEAGRLDLILAHPISRRGLFWGRLAAFAAVSAAIAMLGWLGFALLLGGSSLGVSPWQMALPFLPVLAQTLIYGTLAVLLGTLLPTRRLAAMVTGVVMMASYMASSLASLDDRMALVADYLPYEYFQG